MSTYTTPSGYVGHTVERNCKGNQEIVQIFQLTPFLVANPPAPKVPDDKVLFPDPNSDIPNVQFLKAHFFDEGRLSEEQVCRLVEAGTELLSKEPNLLQIPAPITSKLGMYMCQYHLLILFSCR